MPFCSFADNFHMYDVTPVENLFLQEFMPRAPGDFVRVYLYGLMLCYHPGTDNSMEEIARVLGLEVEEVLDAFRYWERQGVVAQMSDRPPTFAYMNLKATMLTQRQDEADGLYKYRDFNNSLQALYGSDRLLQPQDFSKAIEWIEELKLPEDVVLMLVASQIKKRGKKIGLRSMENLALSWAEKGVGSAADAEELLQFESAQYEGAKRVLRQFGLRRNPTKDELDLMNKWLNEWGMDLSAILYACKETVKGRNPSFGYLDSILQHHKSAGGSRQEMEERLRTQQQQDGLVRSLLLALGLRSVSPTPEQLDKCKSWVEQGFETEVLISAAKVCARRGKSNFEDLNELLAKWFEMGLLTQYALDAYMQNHRAKMDFAKQVFERSGMERGPNQSDLRQIEGWLEQVEAGLVLYAAECAQGTQVPLRYMNKLLQTWAGQGITTEEAARSQRDGRGEGARRDNSAAATAPERPGKTVAGHLYSQRDYQQGELDYLITDLAALGEEEDAVEPEP